MTSLSCRLGDQPTLGATEVGTKAHTLMRLVQAGYPVPPGFVLTTAFFKPWLDRITSTTDWTALLAADSQTLPQACRRVQTMVKSSTLSSQQHEILMDQLSLSGKEELYAVRSSAPAEDLITASFAGTYASVLGIQEAQIAETLPVIVASGFDHRLVAYKRHHHLDIANTSMAVLVQQQVPSEIGGVGFSIHPVSQNPSHAVLESNWGLGQTVVDGSISPDHYQIDKQSRRILQRRMGMKERSLVVAPEGGTLLQEDPRHDQWTLNDDQLENLTELLIRLECEHGYAIDMEWAIYRDRAVVLQVRPMTISPPRRTKSETS